MARQVSDFIIERLSQWGVKRIFGFPGDGINGLMGAMNRATSGPGAIRLVNGLYDAKMDHQPVVSEMRYVDGMKIKDPNKLGQTVALVAGIGIAEFLFSACRN